MLCCVQVINYPRSCFQFVSGIVAQLDWRAIVAFYASRELPLIVARLHVCVFSLLMQAAMDGLLLEQV